MVLGRFSGTSRTVATRNRSMIHGSVIMKITIEIEHPIQTAPQDDE